ncbi:Hypothetical protein, putative, partial [Bodo saltans]
MIFYYCQLASVLSIAGPLLLCYSISLRLHSLSFWCNALIAKSFVIHYHHHVSMCSPFMCKTSNELFGDFVKWNNAFLQSFIV